VMILVICETRVVRINGEPRFTSIVG
jgi:hypothetical protein